MYINIALESCPSDLYLNKEKHIFLRNYLSLKERIQISVPRCAAPRRLDNFEHFAGRRVLQTEYLGDCWIVRNPVFC